MPRLAGVIVGMGMMSERPTITDQSLVRADLDALSRKETPMVLVRCDLDGSDLSDLDLRGWQFETCLGFTCARIWLGEACREHGSQCACTGRAGVHRAPRDYPVPAPLARTQMQIKSLICMGNIGCGGWI